MAQIVPIRLEAAPVSRVVTDNGEGWIYRWNTAEYQIRWSLKPKGMNRVQEQRIINDALLNGAHALAEVDAYSA